MKPVTQTKRGGPTAPLDERGDCFDACLASILELEIGQVPVPHSGDWWDNAMRACERHGQRLLLVYDREMAGQKLTAAVIGEWLGDIYWIASVPSISLGVYPDGQPVGHVVVMRGGEIAHDPGLGPNLRPLGPVDDDVPILDALILVPLASGAVV